MTNLYSEFISKSRYARFLQDQNRRENWTESVDRYMKFMRSHLLQKHEYEIDLDTYKNVRESILHLETLPSMRAIMTAGEALERDNTCAYNCAYLAVDDPKSFDEAMFILLCGKPILASH